MLVVSVVGGFVRVVDASRLVMLLRGGVHCGHAGACGLLLVDAGTGHRA